MLLSLLLVIGIVVVFWSVSGYEFINYDDDIYVTDNIHVREGLSWEGIKWAFTAIDAGFWHPLTWISLMLDYELFRLSAGGYHWTNVLCHIISTLLLFLFLNRITGAVYKSALVAFLFALHPLHVEPVAWIASRKDVLSTLFWMLTMLTYARYAEKPGVGRYTWVLLCFMLGLMSKTMVVTLPVVLLLIDYWPLHRFKSTSAYRLIGEKITMIALALPVVWLTFVAQHKAGALSSLAAYSLAARLSNAAVSCALYVWETFYPAGLAVYYPHPGQWPLWPVLLSVLFLSGVTIFVICYWKRYPYLGVGWFWYLITLVPVSGIAQVGSHARADRYTYIPLIGIFLMVVWGFSVLLKERKCKIPVGVGVSVLTVILLTVLSVHQVRFWKNGIDLSRHTLSVIGENSGTMNNLGNALARKGMIAEAIVQYKEALRLKPDYPDARNNLGNALAQQGQFEEAIVQYAEALRLNPGNHKASFNMAFAYGNLGRFQDAIVLYLDILKNKPGFAEAHNNLGIALATQGRLEEAISHFRTALNIRPNYTDARNNLRVAQQELQIRLKKNDPVQ